MLATDYPAQVYYLQRRDGLIKIGYTCDYPRRFGELKRWYGPLTLVAIHGGNPEIERALHGQFRRSRVSGEWFRPTEELREHIEQVQTEQWKPPPLPPRPCFCGMPDSHRVEVCFRRLAAAAGVSESDVFCMTINAISAACRGD